MNLLLGETQASPAGMPWLEEGKQPEEKEGVLMARIEGVNPEEVDEYTRNVLQAQVKT